MSFLKKIFGGQTTDKQTDIKKPDNRTLLNLLHAWKNNESAENYTNVVNEILNGQSFLLLPSVNDGKSGGDWKTLKTGSTLKLTSVFDVDGLNVLGAFTEESALLTWSRKQTEFTAMKSQDVIEFCQANGIDRIVINSDQPTMFVLERNRENIKSETIQKETQVRVWTPKNPISGKLLEKLKANFSKVSTIREVYHYGMTRNDEHIFILAFSLDIYSEDSRFACMNAIQNSMNGETIEFPLELFYLEDENWYNTAKGISNSLMYTRR
jgi:hypothetical protein